MTTFTFQRVPASIVCFSLSSSAPWLNEEFANVWLAYAASESLDVVVPALLQQLGLSAATVKRSLLFVFSDKVDSDTHAVRALIRTADTNFDTTLRVYPAARLPEWTAGQDGNVVLDQHLRRCSARDPFALPGPAQGQDFYGLERLITELRNAGGEQPMLLHGMRSSGKTSVALRVSELRRRANWIVTDRVVGRVDGARRALGEIIDVVSRAVGHVAVTFNNPGAPSADEAVATLKTCSAKIPSGYVGVFVVVDEMDDLVPRGLSASASVKARELNELCLVVREAAASLRIQCVFVGLASDIATVDRFDGDEEQNGNPLFNKCITRRIEALTPDEARRFLVDVASSVGVAWNDAAVDRVASVTGGHPFLLRSLASRTLRCARDRDVAVARLEVDDVELAEQRDLEAPGPSGRYFESLLSRVGPTGEAIVYQLLDAPKKQADVRRELQRTLSAEHFARFTKATGETQALRVVVRDSQGSLDLFAPMFRTWLNEYR